MRLLSHETRVEGRAWFWRGLGLVYAIAFASLAPQLPGLIGRHGLLPVTAVLNWSDGAWKAADLGAAALSLFRLVFSSGAVKLLSGDAAWRGLTAMQFHYETQPLPNPLCWYLHHLPDGFRTFSTAMVLGLELAVPLLIFTPWKVRRFALVLLAGFEVLILLTGNLAFFNLLTLALCLPLVDEPPHELRAPRWRTWIAGADGGVLLAGNLIELAVLSGVELRSLFWLERYQLVNRYGLFAVMTTMRPKIVIEGSRDGVEWKEYEFRYKPGEVRRAPPVVAPHQPRLDWQMWFAALGSYRRHAWFPMLLQRVLQGSPPVLALLARNPFPGSPPRYVRARLYEYRFTSAAESRATGACWHRELCGDYYPAVSRF